MVGYSLGDVGVLAAVDYACGAYFGCAEEGYNAIDKAIDVAVLFLVGLGVGGTVVSARDECVTVSSA